MTPWRMAAGELYDTLGVGYQAARRPDLRVEAQIHAALGSAQTVLNIGAGTGNYEPDDRFVVAVEPSPQMLRQRTNANPTVRGIAETLPFADNSFDVVMGIFTVHHWSDRAAGLREVDRVSTRQVLLVYDNEMSRTFWLIEYFPWLGSSIVETQAPTSASLAEVLDVIDVAPIWIPDDCTDGFTGAYWNRPERYLDPAVQAGMSSMARLSAAQLSAGSSALRASLDSGRWETEHGHLRAETRFDIGYRLVTCGT